MIFSDSIVIKNRFKKKEMINYFCMENGIGHLKRESLQFLKYIIVKIKAIFNRRTNNLIY